MNKISEIKKTMKKTVNTIIKDVGSVANNAIENKIEVVDDDPYCFIIKVIKYVQKKHSETSQKS